MLVENANNDATKIDFKTEWAFREHRILFFVEYSIVISKSSDESQSLLYNDVVYEKVSNEEEEKESLDYSRMLSRSCCLGSR